MHSEHYLGTMVNTLCSQVLKCSCEAILTPRILKIAGKTFLAQYKLYLAVI